MMKKKRKENLKQYSPKGQNVLSGSNATAKRLGSLFGVDKKTVRRNYEFAKAVDRVKQINGLMLVAAVFAGV